MSPLELTGRVRTHITQLENPRFAVHPETADAFFSMREAAIKEGIDISPFSAFRDFKAQLTIWNKKYEGKRPLYTQDGVKKNFEKLNEKDKLFSILSWSALPGASRHHWGTEIDVIDGAAISEGYKVKLLPEESDPGGVFYNLHEWLDKNLNRFGFFRPFDLYRNGVYPEPWHISYSPVSKIAMEELTLEMVEATILEADIRGKELILELLPTIYHQFVRNVAKNV